MLLHYTGAESNIVKPGLPRGTLRWDSKLPKLLVTILTQLGKLTCYPCYSILFFAKREEGLARAHERREPPATRFTKSLEIGAQLDLGKDFSTWWATLPRPKTSIP